jgi:hypothetical protein
MVLRSGQLTYSWPLYAQPDRLAGSKALQPDSKKEKNSAAIATPGRHRAVSGRKGLAFWSLSLHRGEEKDGWILV